VAYFRSGLQNNDGNWIYSLQSTFEQFVAMYPEDQVDYRSFTIHTTRIVERFLNTGNVAKDKSTGRPTVATPDVLNNVNERVVENPHISVCRLPQQIGKGPLSIIIIAF